MNNEQNTNEANAVGKPVVGDQPAAPAPLAPTPGSGLLPCPFCSVEECHDTCPEVEFIAEEAGYDVTCLFCGTCGPLMGTRADAIKAWNDRPREVELIAAVKNLRDQKGRHNTGVAYERLMKALDAVSQKTPRSPMRNRIRCIVSSANKYPTHETKA